MGNEKPNHTHLERAIQVICGKCTYQPVLHIADKCGNWKASDSFPNTSRPLTSLSQREDVVFLQCWRLTHFPLCNSTKVEASPPHQGRAKGYGSSVLPGHWWGRCIYECLLSAHLGVFCAKTLTKMIRTGIKGLDEFLSQLAPTPEHMQ